jgi:hypothetical protein
VRGPDQTAVATGPRRSLARMTPVFSAAETAPAQGDTPGPTRPSGPLLLTDLSKARNLTVVVAVTENGPL